MKLAIQLEKGKYIGEGLGVVGWGVIWEMLGISRKCGMDGELGIITENFDVFC